MKVSLGTLFVPYGPVGCPSATFFSHYAGFDQEEVAREFHHFVARMEIQGRPFARFFDEDQSLEAQGFYLLPWVDGEVDDAALAALVPPPHARPAPTGTPGRRLDSVVHLLPSYLHLEDQETWETGQPDCDHDLGLETAVLRYKTPDGVIFNADEVFADLPRHGQFFLTFTCTRCGHHLALPERE